MIRGKLVLSEQDFQFVPDHLSYPLPNTLPLTLGPYTKKTVSVGPQRLSTSLPSLPVTLKKNHHSYSLGPFVGILTSDGNSSFRGNHRNFSDIIRTGKKMGVTVFVVTPQSFQYKDFVMGYLLDPKTKTIQWKKAKLPIPNVLYNRIPTRKQETTPAMQQFLETISQKKNMHLFNPRFFNKSKLYTLLQSSPDLHAIVPKSIQLDKPEMLKKMIAKFSSVYLKPIDGKAGIGMIRITKLKGEYELKHQLEKQKHHHTFYNFNDVWASVSQLTNQQPYVIQETIPLATFNGNPFDLRVLVQKDILGNWKLTGLGIRVAGDAAISTHVPMGGKIEEPDTVLQNVFPSSTKKIKDHAIKTSLNIATFIEKHQPGTLFEMSMDLGLDQNGDLWFFEANAKPMKFDEPTIRSLSLRRIIEYSLYLSGYKGVTRDAVPELTI